MIFHAILDQLLNTAGPGAVIGGIFDALKFPDLFFGTTGCTREFDSTCPGSAFNVITAAYATQGYWMQADILDYLDGGMGTLAILIYVLSAIAGIFSMAMGAPPKMYGWFFMGPGIYYWLVQTTTPDTSVDGVRVMMGKPGGEYFSQAAASNEQSKVWRYARVGLEGMSIFRRRDCSLDPDQGYAPSCSNTNEDESGDGAIAPSYFFVKFDTLVSSVIESLIDWTGVYYVTTLDGEQEISAGRNGTISPDHVISTMKWGILEDITSSKLSSPDVRDLFVNFLTSECGDGFAQGIDPQKFVAANSTRKGYFPSGIFYNNEGKDQDRYLTLRQALQDKAIPKPTSVIKLLSARNLNVPGSFVSSFSNSPGSLDSLSKVFTSDSIHCINMLELVVLAFRWQAASVFYQLLTSTPPGMPPGRMLRNFLYGWPIAEELRKDGLDSDENIQEFFINLIMLHMLRNEFSIAPQPISKSNAASKDSIEFSAAYQRTVGQKTKFSELYTWALMIPHLQGLCLMIWSAIFPFACMCIIKPGWHTVLGTWCQFFIFFKSWDLGTAVVTVIERSVWAIIGNDYDATEHLKKLAEMKKWGAHTISCPGSGSNVLTQLCRAESPIPNIELDLVGKSFNTFEGFINSMSFLERHMTLGASMDLGLANSYYIYIMAALYFAIPAVLGQVILGAKAGAAGLVTNPFSQAASEVGRSAGSGYSGDLGKRAEQAAAQAKQTFSAKSMRSGSASENVKAALMMGNRALDKEIQAGRMGEFAHGISRDARIQSLAIGEMKDAIGTGTELQQARISVEQAGATQLGRIGQGVQSGTKLLSGGAGIGSPGGAGAEESASKLVQTVKVGGKMFQAAGETLNQGALMYSDALGAHSTALGSRAKVANFGLSQLERKYQSQSEAEQSEATIKGWSYGAYAKGTSDGARTQSEMAEQRVSDDVADAMTRAAMQTSGTLSAQGVSNPYAISRNASMKAMAGLGMLGSANKKEARYTQDGGGFGAKVDKFRAELLTSFGSQKLNEKFKATSLDEGYTLRNTTWDTQKANDGLIKTIDSEVQSLKFGGKTHGFDGLPVVDPKQNTGVLLGDLDVIQTDRKNSIVTPKLAP